MKNRTILNIISSLMLQAVTMVCGFIIPRIILSLFGSEVNGLVSSLTQILSYVSLLEGGLGGVVAANLYKPLATKNQKKISSVYNATQSFYRRISYIFVLFTLAVAVIYPLVIPTPFSFSYIFTLTLILSATLFIQYNFSISARLLLQADKKVYLVSFVQILITILNTVLFFLISRFWPDIHILKLVTAAVFLIQPLLFSKLLKRHYALDKTAARDQKLLKNRWSGFSINIAAFIHNNTDIVILTLLSTLQAVSIYSVYALVTTGLRQVIFSISAGVNPTIGHLYAKGDKRKLTEKFNLYELSMFILVCFLFTVGGLIIVPFVQFYTSGIHDANYYQPVFATLLVLAEFVYCIREPYTVLAYAADRFKDIRPHAYVEAILNIVISVALVPWLGLVGVAIGTLVAMLYRTIYQVIYLKKRILYRPFRIFLKKLLIFGVASALGVFLCLTLFPISEYTLSNLAIRGLIYVAVLSILYLIAASVFYRKEVASLLTKNKK